MKTNKGFSLIELIIVIGILGVLSTFASFAWSRYANNTNLRTAAREIIADINTMKANAVAKTGTTHTMALNRTAGTYTLTGTTVQTKSLTVYGAGITFNYLPGAVSAFTLTFLARGTLSPVTGDTAVDYIGLTNTRGSTARITFNTTGKTYVTFNMQ